MDDAPTRRRRLTLILVPIVGLVIANNVGSALAPTLAVEHPLLLIALSSTNRHLALVTNQLDAASYYTVGFLRLLVSDPLFYLLGFWYGEAAIRWMEKKSSRTGELLRTVERFFGKAAYPLVFLAPNNYICLFSGASRMPPPIFVAINAAGTLTRLAVIRAAGEAFESPLDSFLDFLRRYQWQATVVTIGIVALQILLDRRRGTSELESISELERELEEEIEQVDGSTSGDRQGDDDDGTGAGGAGRAGGGDASTERPQP